MSHIYATNHQYRASKTAGLLTGVSTQTDFITIDQQASIKPLVEFDQLQVNFEYSARARERRNEINRIQYSDDETTVTYV